MGLSQQNTLEKHSGTLKTKVNLVDYKLLAYLFNRILKIHAALITERRCSLSAANDRQALILS